MISPLRPVTVAFSIHASAKEATRKKMYTPALFLFQSTPPRRRRHTFADTVPSREYFSIHASAKEARSLNTCRSATCMFSIHASAKEATQHIVIPQLSCAYLVSTTFLSTIFSFISQYIVLFPLFRVRMPCVFCVAYDSHYVPLFNIFYILFQGTPF